MHHTSTQTRRSFLKTTVAGAAGLTMTSAGVVRSTASPAAGWTAGLQIHPTIDNLRVVYCRDASMRNGKTVAWVDGYSGMVSQNNAVDADKIKANLDTMARALTQIDDVNFAWATLLRKHPDHSWDQVKAAIKVNALGCNHPRVAIASKICEELIRLGVTPGNITIYDVTCSAEELYTKFVGAGLPEGVVVFDGLNGPDNGQYESFDVTSDVGTLKCTRIIQDVDILVNCAVNKNHYICGDATLTMKNHAGTINRTGRRSGICPGDIEDLSAWNRTDAIIGNPDHFHGIPCRQQLCIIDSLWSNIGGGPGRGPDDLDIDMLVMGTCSPVVDFLCVHKVRKEIMEADHNYTDVMKYMTLFGYSQTVAEDLLTLPPEDNNGYGWVDAAQWIPVGRSAPDGKLPEKSDPLILRQTAGNADVRIDLPRTAPVEHLAIHSVTGRLIVTLPANSRTVLWNGKNSSGIPVPSGTYILHVRSAGKTMSRSFMRH